MEAKVPLHIFVVENNGLFVRMLDYVFSKDILYRFLDFKSGEDSLKNLHLAPELILLDYALPGMNGFETLQEIREHHPAAHVIILLSTDDGRLPAEFLNAGAADYVMKDGTEDEQVIEKVEAFLSRERVYRELQDMTRRPTLKKKIYYAIIILLLLSAGIYYYQ